MNNTCLEVKNQLVTKKERGGMERNVGDIAQQIGGKRRWRSHGRSAEGLGSR